MNYLIVDIGTGNVRVAITNPRGDVLGIEREDVIYKKDENYPDSLFFEPDQLWRQIVDLSLKVLQKVPESRVKAITVSSQREGIVILDSDGNSLIGLPNHDHRGREWEEGLEENELIYKSSGRSPSSLFSALKIVGIREGRPEIFRKLSTFLSISDWGQYMFSGIIGYEHSQASETLLYDVSQKKWSEELCGIFNIERSILPQLHSSGTILGTVLPGIADQLDLEKDTVVVVGGSDTQLAVKSTTPSEEDVVIVSGTTTPIVKITDTFVTDPRKRTWTNRHVEEGSFLLETNAGVTGLNFQRLKDIFYPREDYSVIEEEIKKVPFSSCTASLGSLIAEENVPLTQGGFIFETPVSHQLSRADFVFAALRDIACSIKENYNYLCKVTGHKRPYVWGCGGGFQSEVLRQMIADLLGKEVRIMKGFEHASILGATHVCNDATGGDEHRFGGEFLAVYPNEDNREKISTDTWKKVRKQIRENFIK